MIEGNLVKMAVEADEQVKYTLRLSDHRLALNPLLGKRIHLQFSGVINCQHCGRETKKSFSQGYCYPCSKKLAACDMCIMKPELCHYEQGTCREPEWALSHCFQPHIVYLANSSGVKVGITRHTQVPTRWLDQGAGQAIPIYRAANRYISGLIEVSLKRFVSDRTDWRKMLKSCAEEMPLSEIRDELFVKNAENEQTLFDRFGKDALARLTSMPVEHFNFPVTQYPLKVSSLSFDKVAEISATLMGIKGQYLILDSGVLNLRKHTGYHISFDVES